MHACSACLVFKQRVSCTPLLSLQRRSAIESVTNRQDMCWYRDPKLQVIHARHGPIISLHRFCDVFDQRTTSFEQCSVWHASDKGISLLQTGTLTENRMTVVEGWFAGRKYDAVPEPQDLPESFFDMFQSNVAINSSVSSWPAAAQCALS